MSSKICNGLSVEVNNKLAIITLNRPNKKNALNMEMYEGLTKTLNELSDNPDVTITVITGTGDFYSSGNDLTSAMTTASSIEEAVEQSTKKVRMFVEAFINHKKVLVAVVNGPAIGIATTTLPLCDIVYCTPKAWFSTPFTELGICAEGCSSYTFPRLLGTSKANEMLLFNGRLTAQEAVSRGFVSRIVPTENMENEVWSILRNNAAHLSSKSLRSSKELMRRFDEDKLNESNRLECAQLRKLFISDEAKEAILRICDGLKVEVNNRLAIITLNRPNKKNAINKEMYEGLTKTLNELSERPDVTVTAITATGDFYSSGNDLSLPSSTDRVRMLVEAFINHKKVLVAVVNGPAIGIATTTLPLFDIVYCTPNAWFRTPFTELGVCAEGCSSYTFPRLLGTSKANEMLLFSGRLTAQEAAARGFVLRIVSAENMENEVWSMLRSNAAQLSSKSLQLSKELMRRFDEDKLNESNRLECVQLRKLSVSDEAKEAIVRFVKRRSKL